MMVWGTDGAMNTDTAIELLAALLVVLVAALEVQIIKINKKLGDLAGRVAN
jgi:hypothetical protein